MSFETVPPAVHDNSTLSSYTSVHVELTCVDLEIDWAAKKLCGSVTHHLTSELPAVVLDSSYLQVDKVEWSGRALEFEVGARDGFRGSPLTVRGVPVDAAGELTVFYSTTSECTGLQWLDKEQTSSKTAPFLFSQCEAIHARSILPCFDTPSVKVPYRFAIRSEHPVLVSGTPVSEGTFEQRVPIPSYLFAICAGNLKSKLVGPRSRVWAEPDIVDACQYEFEADTEKQLAAAESLLFPYEWGTYDVVVLPPSFPFGGMENPNITFATPTLISGDRTLVNVIAHELAHSWSGNLVTNATWAHFWLNEGWTVYLERRILGKLHGEPFRHFAATEGWQDLQRAVAGLPPAYTRLVLDVGPDVDPDDTFSTVPYEKGSTFLWHLEELVGRAAFDRFAKLWFETYKYKSVDSFEFKQLFSQTFGDAAAKVDWDTWFYGEGLPPKPHFNDELLRACEDLAARWTSPSTVHHAQWREWASKENIAQWQPLQVIVFLNLVLEKLPRVEQDANVGAAAADLGAIYEIAGSQNSEVLFRWLQLAVRARVAGAAEEVAAWLGSVGRMKFVRPLYKLLSATDRELAVRTFKKNRLFYHAICRQLVEKDLGL